MHSKGSELIIHWYIDLENRLRQFLKIVPYDHQNKNVVLPLLSSIIVEAGSLIDTIFREEFKKTKKKKLTISDFAPHYENILNLSQKKTIFYNFPLSYIQPFLNWCDKKKKNYVTLDWWTNYNQLKHNRIEKHSLSTLDTAIKSLCALHQTISQLPTFFEALVRNNMICFGRLNKEFARKAIFQDPPTETLLVESFLFATTLGRIELPEEPENIELSYLQSSEKLRRFLGRDF